MFILKIPTDLDSACQKENLWPTLLEKPQTVNANIFALEKNHFQIFSCVRLPPQKPFFNASFNNKFKKKFAGP
jgi:hypothetical protein